MIEELKIYQAAIKIFPENFDIKHYLEILFAYPENEWFAPTNKDNDAYSICEQLGAMHLIAMRRVPVWHESSFRGIKTECFYNKNLTYENVYNHIK